MLRTLPILLLTLALALLPGTAPAATNGRLVVAIDRADQLYEIWTMNADGSDRLRLTDNDVVEDHPSYSPDGTKIAFDSERDGDSDIYVMDADGTNVVQLVDAKGADAEPAWSPDGTKIAYETFRHDPDEILPEIRVVALDGSSDRRITSNKRFEYNVTWSPDGARLAFASQKFRDGSNWGIFTIRSTGGDLRRVTRNTRVGGGGVDGSPSYSPDGRWIVFQREWDALDYADEIFKVRTNGRRLTRLTRHVGVDQQPEWSPDGTKIVYTSDFQVVVMATDGSGKTQITNDAETAFYGPSWQALP